MSVKDNLDHIKQDIKEICTSVNRKPEEINIIGVTKYVSNETAKEAVQAGVYHLGENRDQGLLEKSEALENKVTWHFIGSLQSRKVKNIIGTVDYIHSLDRIALAEEINKRSSGKKVKCFVQVNGSYEKAKHGVHPDEVLEFIKNLEPYPYIQVVGLMTMAEHTDDERVIRNTFATVSELKKRVQALKLPFAPCTELSMGMSNDYKIAIEEGATFIRIGSALVGSKT